MNTPSVKTLRRIFAQNAVQAKLLLTCPTNEIQTPEVVALRRQSFRPQKRYMIRLTALAALGEFCDVESLCSTSEEYAEYLNAGDLYAETLIYWRGSYRVQCLADFIETMARQSVRFE